jgi:2-polyprenyl-6-methoxyphenol hydroxylase-like FAD-dependent oxidoreductase
LNEQSIGELSEFRMIEQETLRSPVAIVGGGPVGLMLALFLERHGVSSVVFNTDPTVRWHPKGSTHNARTMEHYRRLGFSDQVRGLGFPRDYPTDVAYFTRFNAWELARLRMPSTAQKLDWVAQSPKLSQVPEPIHRANQMYVEALLLQRARLAPNITLRFGWEVRSFSEQADGVRLEAEQVSSGAAERWNVLYLAGCDGGRSFVRRTLGIGYHDSEALKQAYFGGRMQSKYLRAPTLGRGFLAGRRGFQYWIVNPELRTTIIDLNGEDEFLLLTKADGPDRPFDDDLIGNVLRRCAGAEIPFQVLSRQPWTAGIALVSESFGSQRVVLAGDAVHLFTPTGGFGMNTGIDDAANLSWKIAALVQGWGGSRLMETYESERKPIALRNTQAARNLAKSVGDVPVRPEMEEDSPAGAKARLEAAQFLSGFGEEFASIGVQLGARYDGSPIVVADGAPPSDGPAEYVPTSVPGGRAPHFWIDVRRCAGGSAFDHFGTGFTLLRLREAADSGAGLASAAKRLGVPLKVVDLCDPEVRDFYGRDFALIRPDQYVAWRGNRCSENPHKVISQVIGI